MPEESQLPASAGTDQVYDAAVWENLPRHSSLLLYRDGNYAVPGNAVTELMPARVRYITVLGDYRNCGVIDWERYNPCFTPAGLRSYVRGRQGLGHTARVYCDRADAAEAVAALRDFGNGDLLRDGDLLWFIATLDGHQWTAHELADDLAQNWGAPEITADLIWANQYATNGLYDTSTLFGNW